MTRAKNYDSHFAAKREMAKTTDNSNMSEDIETKQLITTAPSRRNKRKFFQQMTLPIVAFGGFLLLSAAFFGGVVQAGSNQPCSAPCIPGTEEIMSRKEHGTSHTPVQENLRWKCDRDTADRICNFNRHYAEYSGYWKKTAFLDDLNESSDDKITFYDSNTGKPLFNAPMNRTWSEWIKESSMHGWPSFRDDEVNWDFVRVLSDGETVSVDGTHLGHNLPDRKGNRYCINLVSVAGRPKGSTNEGDESTR